jgi:hypothetical protein
MIYEGRARAGTSPSVAAWAIRKFTWTANGSAYNLTLVQWAGSTTAMSQVWDNYAGLTYA